MSRGVCFLTVLLASILAAGSAWALPDLQVTTLSVNPTSQVPGGSVTVTYRVHNAGDATAASFSIRFYHSTDATITTSDTPLQAKYINSVAPGAYYPASNNATVSFALPGSLPVGNGYIGAIVDYDDEVTESDETNNTRSTPITILPPDVDLEVTMLSASPTSAAPGGSVTVTYRLRNTGSTAAGGFTLRFYHSSDATITTSDTYLGSQVQVSSLAASAYYPASANGTVNVTLPGTLTPGSGYIGAIVDYDDSVTETDETNNTRSTPITILPPDVDLEVTTLSVQPTSATPGQSVTITYRVHNAGSIAATGFHVRFYHSTDATITTFDTYLGSEISVTSLAAKAYFPAGANGTVNVTLPGTLTPGSGHIGAIVDYDDSVTESDETNNTKATAFTVLSNGGIACTSASQCSSGFCVDGVCCNTACGGGAVDCQACSTAAGGPVDGTCSMLSSTTVCRPAAGMCDEAETCTGASPTCPTDLFKVSGTVCRVAAGLCDEAEVCSGSSAACPTDALKPTGAVCRAAAGECDLAEQCTGTASCPADLYKPNGLPCSGGLCSGGTCIATPDSGLPDQGLDGGVDAGPEAGVDATVEAGADALVAEAGVDGPVPDATITVDGPAVDGTIPADGAVDVSAPDATLPTDGSPAPDLARDAGTDDDSGDGCSCRLGAGPSRGGAALALLLLLGLVLWRRRD